MKKIFALLLSLSFFANSAIAKSEVKEQSGRHYFWESIFDGAANGMALAAIDIATGGHIWALSWLMGGSLKRANIEDKGNYLGYSEKDIINANRFSNAASWFSYCMMFTTLNNRQGENAQPSLDKAFYSMMTIGAFLGWIV